MFVRVRLVLRRVASGRDAHELGNAVAAGPDVDGLRETLKSRCLTVNTDARIATQAAPGEVLLSSTVNDIVAGPGLRFDERALVVSEHP